MKRLTDDECDEFRRLPVNFNDMVRAAYNAGYKDKDNIINKLVEELEKLHDFTFCNIDPLEEDEYEKYLSKKVYDALNKAKELT